MKLGLLTSILGDMNFEEVVSYASDMGFEGLEVACWPSGKAERRYAGVSHIDTANMAEEYTTRIHSLCSDHNIALSALSYYPNVMDADEKKAEVCLDHLYTVIRAAGKLGVEVVGTFIGRDQTRSVSYNLDKFVDVWTPVIKEAEKYKVKIAIENCPMLFTEDEWPGGQNLAFSPVVWDKMFNLIPSNNFGLNFDPSHFIWQQMDYIKAVYEFKDKLFHVHFKDIALDYERLGRAGVLAAPLDYMDPRIPGRGDVNWEKLVEALYDVGYQGFAAVEIEDKEYEGSLEKIKESISLSYDYMRKVLSK